MRAYDAICATEWNMRPEFLVTMLGIANRENPLDPDIVSSLIKPEAISTQDGLALTGADTIEVRDGVAVIPVNGPLMRYASMFSKISGATSYATIARDFSLALRDPNINSILLNIDSPGGQVNGVGELASIIHASRGIKPIYAYISNEGASAAYYLASAAEHIVVAPSAIVGSIGTIAAYPDPKANGGSKTIDIVSSQSPDKRVDISTKEGKSKIQAIVDSLAQVFVEAVALHRNTTVDNVLENYGQGGVFIGQQAIDAGMVDAIGSYESTIALMTEVTRPKSNNTKEVKSMSLKSELMAFLQGHADDDESTVTPVATNVVPAPAITANVTSVVPIVDNTVKEQLRASQEENRRLRLERYQAEGTGFADTLIASNMAFPAEREPLIAAFVQASFDDQTFGASSDNGTSRVEMLKNIMSVRPKHVLTAEQLAPALQHFATMNAAPEKLDPASPLTDEQMNKMLGMTDLGRDFLAATNGSAK